MSLSSKNTLADLVLEQIRFDILEGYYQPEQKLLIDELSQRYNTGSFPVREALLKLISYRYVEMKAQRGFWVTAVSVDELKNILAVYKHLVMLIIPPVIENGNDDWELRIISAFHRLDKICLSSKSLDIKDWRGKHIAFHVEIISGANSDIFKDLFELLYCQIERYRYIWLSKNISPDVRYNDHGEHRLILDAALARDTHTLITLLQKHSASLLDFIKTDATATV